MVCVACVMLIIGHSKCDKGENWCRGKLLRSGVVFLFDIKKRVFLVSLCHRERACSEESM